jgi:hypothetical protein
MERKVIHQHPDTLVEGVKHLADAASISIAVGALFGYLPAIAAILTIIWTGIRIIETKTVQRLLGYKPDPD